jgi:hypothetical protein
MGHANASTTLDRYTHAPTDYADRVRAEFEDHTDDLLTFSSSDSPEDDGDDGTALPLPA